ncbi:GTP-binding protein, partial [Acinetobacter indicus]|uniref:GTP-binding protein n=1 Tax=Acinetobacter indicus TaxID=756892 RepID=UPI003EB94DD1
PSAPVYEPWIDLRATLCLPDPRQLLDEKAVANDNFRDQLACADIIVANKEDRATAESQAAFDAWWQHFGGNRQRVQTTQGKIDVALLDLPRLS